MAKAKASKGSASEPSKPRRSRPKLGDVFELTLSDGRLAYFQYVTEDRRPPPGFSGNGSLIRMLRGLHEKRPPAPAALAEQEGEQFLIFFAIGPAAHQGLVQLVGHAAVPAGLQSLPKFKKFNEDRLNGTRLYYLMDPAKSLDFEPIGPKIPRAMLDYPLPYIANLAALIQRTEDGWTHRQVVRPQDIAD